MGFVTFCCGRFAKGASFCCGGSEKLPAVRRLDNTLEHARVSRCYCAEKNKRSVRPDNALGHTIISFCFGGPEKLPAVRGTDNTIILLEGSLRAGPPTFHSLENGSN